MPDRSLCFGECLWHPRRVPPGIQGLHLGYRSVGMGKASRKKAPNSEQVTRPSLSLHIDAFASSPTILHSSVYSHSLPHPLQSPQARRGGRRETTFPRRRRGRRRLPLAPFPRVRSLPPTRTECMGASAPCHGAPASARPTALTSGPRHGPAASNGPAGLQSLLISCLIRRFPAAAEPNLHL